MSDQDQLGHIITIALLQDRIYTNPIFAENSGNSGQNPRAVGYGHANIILSIELTDWQNSFFFITGAAYPGIGMESHVSRHFNDISNHRAGSRHFSSSPTIMHYFPHCITAHKNSVENSVNKS